MSKQSHLFDTVISLILVIVFITCMFLVLGTGITIYRNISSVMDEQYTLRTATDYVAAKIRHGNMADQVNICDFGGNCSIVIDQDIEETTYKTYIYWYDGYLCELMCQEGSSLGPEDGEQIIKIDGVDFSVTGDRLIQMRCISGDREITQYISLYTEWLGIIV